MLFVIMSNNNGLDQLAEASSLTNALLGIQQDLQSLREDVNRLKGTGNYSTLHLPQSGDERASETITPRSGVQEPTKRIPETSWAEEMDILDPILAEEPGDAARIVEVTPRTEACIKAGFQCQCLMPPGDACTANIFPKVPTTIASPPLGQGLRQLLLEEHKAIRQGFGAYPGPHVGCCGTIIGSFRNDKLQGGGQSGS